MFRVQRLLMTEYHDFNDFVLVESPFAQITGIGRGIRQVHIALSETKLIIAADKFHNKIPNSISNVHSYNIDPEVETLELLYLIPLNFLRLKLYNLGTRQILRVDIQNRKTWFFEHGLHVYRDLFWNEWQTAIANLRGKDLKTSICSERLTSTSFTDSSFENISQKFFQIKNNSTFLQSELITKKNCFALDSKIIQNYDGELPKSYQNRLLYNTVNLYLETQSEIIGIQNHGTAMNTYFKNQHPKSVSVDNIYSRCRCLY